jgi:hypothetical protein
MTEEILFDKESVYDNEISPLMKQIIEICKRENIPMAFNFAIKDDGEEEGWLYCTTVHDHKSDPDVPYVEKIEKARELFYPAKPLFMAMRIYSGDKK